MNAEEQKAAYDRLRQAAADLPDSIGAYFDSKGVDQLPAADSIAAADGPAYGDAEAGRTIKGQVWLLIEAAADNLDGVVRLLDEPALLIAPFACARCVLEESAQALWLLDAHVGGGARLGRSMSLRLNSLNDQVRIMRSMSDSSGLIRMATRRRELAAIAKARGVAVKRDGRGLIVGVGPEIPDMTVLARNYLQAETLYRAFSAMTHGQGVIILRAVFKQVEGQPGVFEKHMSTDMAANIVTRSATWFARAVWAYFSYLGWASQEVVSILETSFDSMLIDEKERFWRPGSTA